MHDDPAASGFRMRSEPTPYSVLMRLILGSSVFALALVLTACSSGVQSAAQKCGGEEAGITLQEDGAVLVYEQSSDQSGDAWKCVVKTLLPEQADQLIPMLNTEDIGVPGEFIGGYLVAWSFDPVEGLFLAFFPEDSESPYFRE